MAIVLLRGGATRLIFKGVGAAEPQREIIDGSSNPMETGKMCKTFVTLAAALAIASLGSLAAQAGNGAQGTSKYNNQIGQSYRYQAANYPITEFSSSSAKPAGPHR